jgi:Zn-dependent membrane protease YugP
MDVMGVVIALGVMVSLEFFLLYDLILRTVLVLSLVTLLIKFSCSKKKKTKTKMQIYVNNHLFKEK